MRQADGRDMDFVEFNRRTQVYLRALVDSQLGSNLAVAYSRHIVSATSCDCRQEWGVQRLQKRVLRVGIYTFRYRKYGKVFQSHK